MLISNSLVLMKRRTARQAGGTVLDFDKLFHRKNALESLTGVEEKEFRRMADEVGGKHKRDAGTTRSGRGRKPALRTVREKLFFILFYTHVRPTQQTAADFLNVSVGTVNNWIRQYAPLLEQELGREIKSSPRVRSLQELADRYPLTQDVVRGGTSGDSGGVPEDQSDKKKRVESSKKNAVASRSAEKRDESARNRPDDYMELLMQL